MSYANRAIASTYAWACERLYHEFAWTYDWVAWGVSGGAWAAWRRASLDFVIGPRVLELGIGTGHLVREGQARGLHVTGVDLSPNMVTEAQRTTQDGDPNRVIVRARAEQLPFGLDSFDTVLATFPAPYIFSSATLAEAWRVLDGREGRLVVGGLWVVPRWSRYMNLPVLYGAPNAGRLAEVAERLAAAGFAAPAFISVDVSGAKVGVLTARRQDKP